MKIFAVRDVKAGCYLRPLAESHAPGALRAFEVAVNSPDSTFSRHPDDFALHELADFCSQTGKLTVHNDPINLGYASALVKRAPVQMELPQ